MQSKQNAVLLILSLSLGFSAPLSFASADANHEVGTANPRDWQHFNPKKFEQPKRLVPAELLAPAKGKFFGSGTPMFPHDPTRTNIIFGAGKDKLPTEIYAKAYDILQIGSKYFQAPAAGESRHISIDGASVTLYGTTWYTPLQNAAYVGNPVQISPFDPTRVFYADKATWPSVIYVEPGKDIVIANQKFHAPGPGETVELRFSKEGHYLGSSKDGAKKSEDTQGSGSSDSAKAQCFRLFRRSGILAHWNPAR